jgi:hypothetical protein
MSHSRARGASDGNAERSKIERDKGVSDCEWANGEEEHVKPKALARRGERERVWLASLVS